MTTDGNTLVHHRTVFDDWRSITIGIYMALVGYGVLVGIPVISTAWVSQLGFSEIEVGRVAGADLGGLSVGAVLASLIVATVNRRLIIVVAIIIAVGANALCMIVMSYEWTLWLRFIAGVGSGIYTAVAVATLGGSSKPARTFNMLLFAFAFSQAAELYVLPMLSVNSIYTVFIAGYLLTLPFLHWVPPRPVDKALDVEVDVEEAGGGHHIEHRHVPAWVPWLVLATVTFTYINIGAYWTYIELASFGSEASQGWVSTLLVYASFLSIVACLFSTLISNRFGLARPMIATLICQAIIVGMLAGGINNVNIMISLFSFNFLWIFVDVYQFASVANVDHSGRFQALVPAAQGLGQILGPNIAATVLAFGFGYSGVFIMCALASLTGMLIYLSMYLRLRATFPALADAS
jgi:MFS family permease